MMRINSAGHALFAATLVVIGTLGFIRGDFAPVWEPVRKGLPAREALVYLSASISLGAGLGLLWRRTAAAAARVLLIALLLWLLGFRVPVILHAPLVEGSWEGTAETVVMVAGAWVLYAWFAADSDRRYVGFATGEPGVRIARVLFGLALIPFGLAHLVYLKETVSLIPAWLPAPAMWASLTGCTYLAAGVAIVTGVYARLAAALVTVQMGLFTLLVWLPIVAAGAQDRSQWSETVLSWALTTAGWVVADSYRGARAAGGGTRRR